MVTIAPCLPCLQFVTCKTTLDLDNQFIFDIEKFNVDSSCMGYRLKFGVIKVHGAWFLNGVLIELYL